MGTAYNPGSSVRDRIRQRVELASARIKARNDGLVMFRPLQPCYSDQIAFLEEICFEQISMGGNRSGKSVGAAVKVAAIARGVTIKTHDGKVIDCRLPHQKNRKLEIWVIGYDWEHIGHTIHKMLFEPQLYKVIADEKSGHLRAWRPWEPEDAARRPELVYAPPLIPESEIAEIAWENKAKKQFSRVDLKNGNTIFAFASTGAVKAGDAVDLIWIDEKIQFPEYVAEWQARLVDNQGIFIWSSWPYGENAALREIVERAEEQAGAIARGDQEKLRELTGGRERYTSRVFYSTFEKNPYLPPEEVRAQIIRWGVKEAKARNQGQFVTDGTPIYPDFDRKIHCAIYRQGDERRDAISEILESTGGIPPEDWCCDLILDPGTAKPGVVAMAVPPPRFWGLQPEPPVIFWDEIYPSKTEGRGMNAYELAMHIMEKHPGRIWHRFIIDGHAGRRTPEGFDLTVQQNYENEFANHGLTCMLTDSRFIHGSDDFFARSMAVQKAMVIRTDGRPLFRVVTHRCQQLCLQLETNTKKMMKDVEDERAATGQRDDLRVCVEYGISRKPVYVTPVNLRDQQEWEDAQRWEREFAGATPRRGVHLGVRGIS